MKKCGLIPTLCIVLINGAYAATKYYSVPCSAFRPNYSEQTFYVHPNKLYATNVVGNNWYTAPVYLPDNAIVTEYKAWVYDTNGPYDITVRLARAQLSEMGFLEDILASIQSSGASGLQELTEGTIQYALINNSLYKYYTGVGLSASGDTTTMLVGVRITYESPPIGVKESSANVPQHSMFRNYPNPTSSVTIIEYTVAKKNRVVLKIYNEIGQLIRTLVDAEKNHGEHTVVWDGKNDEGEKVAKGNYFCIIKANGSTTIKVVRIK